MRPPAEFIYNILFSLYTHNTTVKLYSLFFLFIFVLQLQAQNHIKGNVVDAESGKPIAGAIVYIPLLSKGSVSDAEGIFVLSNIPAGSFEVQISCLGYKSVVAFMTPAERQQTISLSPSNVEMDEVYVLGNSVNSTEKVPYKVELLSKEEIKSGGFATLQNALALIPGVSELSNGLSISKPVIRGMYGYRTAAMVNGMRFDNQEWQDEHGFGLQSTGVGSIEVIEGPAALLYGGNILGGAVNFLPPAFAAEGKKDAEIGLGLFTNTLGASLDFSMRNSLNEKLKWQLHIGGNSHADYLASGGVKIPNTRFSGGNMRALAEYRHSLGLTLIDYNLGYNISGVVEAFNLDNPKDLAEDHFERGFEGPHHIIFFNTITLNNTFTSGSSVIIVNLGFQNNNRMEDEGNETVQSYLPDPGEMELMLNTLSYKAEIIHPLFGNTFISAGIDGSYRNNKNEGKRFLIPDAVMNDFSGFTYIKTNTGNLVLEGGLRFDNSSVKTTEHIAVIKALGQFSFAGNMPARSRSFSLLNAAGGAAYTLGSNITFKANVATGFRSPNLAELSSNGHHEGTYRYEFGNENLNCEKNIQFDAGFIFAHKNLKISLTGFKNNIKDYIFLGLLEYGLNDFNFYEFKQTDAVFTGGEATLDMRLFNHLDVTAQFSTLTGKTISGDYLPFIPADKLIVQLASEFADYSLFKENYAYVRSRNYFTQNHPSADETRTPGYTLIDAGVKTEVTIQNVPLQFSLNVLNLLDKKYISHLSLLKSFAHYYMGAIDDMGINVHLAVSAPLPF